jgi:hypothetical protein
MKRLGLLVLFIFLCILLYTDQVAYTTDGKKVLLKDNGTWEYVIEATRGDDFDFRKTNWGFSMDQVKNSESLSLVREEQNALMYKGTLSDLDCYVVFVFAKGKLVRTKYVIVEEHSNKNDYIRDYESLKRLLSNKYGTPIQDKTIWRNSLYKDDREEWGFAVSLGHLVYLSTWETSETEISDFLYGDNYEISLGIEYSSKFLKSLEQAEKEQATQGDL